MEYDKLNNHKHAIKMKLHLPDSENSGNVIYWGGGATDLVTNITHTVRQLSPTMMTEVVQRGKAIRL